MLGDPDEGTVSERLWSQIQDRLGFLAPIWIVRRPESLTIIDYRPTLMMFLTTAGFFILASIFVLILFNVNVTDSFGIWAIGIFALTCGVLSFRGTIRETYYFDRESGTYMFVRRFIYRKEVIEGAISQFTGAYVKTETSDDTELYYVALKQEGMFLTGVSEQLLREKTAILNTYDNESRIADAISNFLTAKQ